jgi:ABC-type sugar transport system ATPase subunit
MTALVDIQHVSKRFGAVQALSDVSLQLHAGQRVAFVGANGSGKTTLMR